MNRRGTDGNNREGEEHDENNSGGEGGDDDQVRFKGYKLEILKMGTAQAELDQFVHEVKVRSSTEAATFDTESVKDPSRPDNDFSRGKKVGKKSNKRATGLATDSILSLPIFAKKKYCSCLK